MAVLYNYSIRAFSLAIALGALFNHKARQLHRGRRGLLRRIEQSESASRQALPEARSIWIHCASLGEFEQGRPLIDALRERHPAGSAEYRRIIVTFFSPSGYEVRKNYDKADAIYYLPADTPANARRFIAAVRPEMAIFVKYEYWYNYLTALHTAGARSYVVSAIFQQGTAFFKQHAIGRFMRRTLGLLDHFYVQNEESRQLLSTIGFGPERVTVSGDTRFDRVVTLASHAPELPFVATFAQTATTATAATTAVKRGVMVCGSTWPQDEEIILPLMAAHPTLRFIIAPHEIEPARIEAFIQRSGRKALRYTSLSAATSQVELQEATLLVVDTIGILSGVYRYGDIAYIGGGFGRGIHNTLEAATWGMPVLFGPKYQAFAEAVELVSLGAAEPVTDATTLQQTVAGLLSDPASLALRGAKAESYVRSRAGATEIILSSIGK